MSDTQAEIEALCDVHQDPGRLVVRREGDRIVLDGHADDCCVISLSDPAGWRPVVLTEAGRTRHEQLRRRGAGGVGIR